MVYKCLAVCMLLAVASPASAQWWSDDFDSYSSGTDLNGVGGWLGWAGDANSGALVTDSIWNSGPNSLAVDGTGPGNLVTDLVQEFDTDGTGIYTLTVDTYLPSGSTGSQFFIMLNQYGVAGPNNWSTQTVFNNDTGMITESDAEIGESGEIPIVYDAWTTIEMVINLDADTVSFSYNDVSLFSGQNWSQDGVLDIGAIDLWSNFASVMYYDNFNMTPAPGSLALLALGGLVARRRRRN